MATSSFLVFTPYGADPLTTEGTHLPITDLRGVAYAGNTLLEVSDYSFDVEQVLNIGSQSSGAGAGKITFNPFTITKKIDRLSTVLFQNCASGTPFARLDLLVVLNAGKARPSVLLQYTMKLAALKTVSYVDDDLAPTERVSFEYGGLQIRYATQRPDGQAGTVLVSGWNRVRNILDVGDDVLR